MAAAWGVEVKAGATVTEADGRGLRRLAEAAGRHFKGGVLLHALSAEVVTEAMRLSAFPKRDPADELMALGSSDLP